MAEEIEQPFSLSFQANSIHSGSISFGRFENELLSWERRSSFSHNRYLEEVEKCSKPGSVTEKKAYFEAHFKKKGIRFPGSSEAQTWGLHQSGENNVLNQYEAGYVTESNNCDQSDESFPENTSQLDCPCNYSYNQSQGDQGIDQNECAAKNNHCASYDESLESSDNAIELYKEDYDHGPLSISLDSTEVIVDCVNEEDYFKESCKEELGCPETPLGIEVKDGNKGKQPCAYESPQSVETSAGVEETSSEHSQHIPTKVCQQPFDATEGPLSPPGLKSREKVSHFRKIVPPAATKASIKGKKTIEKASPGRIKGSLRPNSNIHRKSPKELRPKRSVKTMESQALTSDKTESRTPLATNRCKPGIDSGKQQKGTGRAGFHFKSGERAEKRKEFYMKLEEKMHAKEAETNRVQAKTQKKVEAEIKQFRKSLIFKATPMPSFYNTGSRPGPCNKYATPRRPRHNPTSPADGASTQLASANHSRGRLSEASDDHSSAKSRVSCRKQRVTEKQSGEAETKQKVVANAISRGSWAVEVAS